MPLGFDGLECETAKPFALVLGGSSVHIPLVETLQHRGYYVGLIDYLDNPPAKKYADCHFQVSTFDKQAIKEIAIEHKVQLIINCCLEYLNQIICEIAEELSLPVPYSSATAKSVSDKLLMKTIMREHGIPTSSFVCISSLEELDEANLHYPLFVKPVDGSGSTGVSCARDRHDVAACLENALAFSRSGQAIVEEESRGTEHNVYCYVLDGVTKVLLVSEKYCEASDGFENIKCIGTFAPARITEQAAKTIELVVQEISDAFSLRTTPLFAQVMIDGNDVSVIEFACRVPGGYGNRSLESKLSFDYYDYTISSFLGETPAIDLHDGGEISIVHSLYAKPCILASIEGYEELIQNGTILDVNIARVPGDVVSDESCNREKVGHFVVAASTVEDANRKMDAFFDSVRVVSAEGVNVLRTDLRLDLKEDSAPSV